MKIQDATDDGKMFSVEFIKRTTGETREMICRRGVLSHLKGGDAAYDPKENGLLWVFDTQKDGYRSIPLENVIKVKIRGVTYECDKNGKLTPSSK